MVTNWSQNAVISNHFQGLPATSKPQGNKSESYHIRFKFGIRPRRFIKSCTNGKCMKIHISLLEAYKLKIPITQRVTGTYYID